MHLVLGIQRNDLPAEVSNSSETVKSFTDPSKTVAVGKPGSLHIPNFDVSKTNFDRIITTPTSFDGIDVSMYKSRETGLKVIIANVEVPIVNGYFTVATEILNDSGCPHTLEHLIFLGSEKYPYKGMLDTIANRCF